MTAYNILTDIVGETPKWGLRLLVLHKYQIDNSKVPQTSQYFAYTDTITPISQASDLEAVMNGMNERTGQYGVNGELVKWLE